MIHWISQNWLVIAFSVIITLTIIYLLQRWQKSSERPIVETSRLDELGFSDARCPKCGYVWQPRGGSWDCPACTPRSTYIDPKTITIIDPKPGQ